MGEWNPLSNVYEPAIKTKVIVAPREAWGKVRDAIASQDSAYRVVLVHPGAGAAKVQGLKITSWETKHCSPRDHEEITKSGLREMLDSRVRP